MRVSLGKKKNKFTKVFLFLFKGLNLCFCSSLISKCKEEMNLSPDLNDEANLDLLNSTSELILIQHLAKYDEVVWQAYQEYEPYHIVQYLFQLV